MIHDCVTRLYIWQGLKAITNYKPSPKNTTATDTNLPDRLNDFYSLFDNLNTTSPSSITPSSSLPPFTVDEYVVRSMFQRLNTRKGCRSGQHLSMST